MSSNVVFKLSKETIIISEIKKDVDYKSLNNTNVIDIKELKFSTDYIKQNFELVSNFLNVVILKNNITSVQINNMDIANISIDLINEWNYIKKIIFKPDKKITLELFLKLLDNKYAEEIECYEMPSYLIERLDVNKKVKVTTRNKIVSKTKFMIVNNLNSYSDLYYKKVIVLSGEFKLEDLEDFKNFIRVNEKLKVIKIVNYSNELLTSIIDEITNLKKKNLLIEINEKNNDLNTIFNSVNYIKKKNAKYFENNNIRFKLNYSKEYKNNNFLKEINFKMLSCIILLIVILSAIVVGINYYQQYVDQNKIEEQMLEITEILSEAEEYTSIDDNETDIDYIDVGDETTTTTTKKKNNYVSAYYTNYEQVFETLLKKNNDTVGWLTVNNTKINYPVVQGDTNSYYLNRDFNKKKNSMGWIFMDYRNDPVNLNKNTIIYGHNIKQGIMFGTIKNMMNSSWNKKANNQIITFNTISQNMRWQIFSLYKIATTDDYLRTDFDTDEEYMEFLNMLKSRSLRDFGVELTPNSKIITLSTCFTSNTRHVVHAVLIEDTSEEPITENTQEPTTTLTQ